MVVTTILMCGLAIGLLPEPGLAQANEFADTAQLGGVTDKAADAVAAVREFFNDDRVQTAIVLILIVLGLTLWLLGARAGRLLFALLLGTAGVAPGMYLAAALELPLWPGALAGGLLGMLLGVFIFRIGIMLVGMCISTMLALGIFAVIYMETDDQVNLRNAVQDCLVSVQKEDSSNLTYTAETKGERIAFSVGLDSNKPSVETIKQLLEKYRGGLLVAAVIGMATGLLLQLFASSFMLILTTACLGTTMVLSGVWLWLALRGQKPEEQLGLKPISSVVVFLVMLALGMLVQLTMTRKRPEPETEEETE
ncbi:MAG: hypothetical protein GWP14_10490 [Actinobacteria bacterium]|nr:hypothetical protein [Actinomycetota bacterium]